MGRSASTAAVAMLGVLVAVAALNLPTTIILAHQLKPAGYGEFQFLNRLAFIAITVAQLGLPHALAWAASRSGTDDERRAVYRYGLRTASAAGAALGLVGCAVALVGPASYRSPAWLLLCLFPLLNLVSAAVASCARGLLDLRSVAMIRVSQAATWFAAVLLLTLTADLTVTSTVLALVVAQAVSAGLAVWVASRLRPTGPAARADTPGIRRFARRVYPGHTVTSWNLYLDQVILGFVLPPAQLGLYAAAAGLTFSLALIGNAVGAIAQPMVQKSPDPYTLTTQLVAATFTVVGLGVATLAVTAPWVVPLLLGDAYRESIPIVMILCGAALLEGITTCLFGVLLGLGAPKVVSRSALTGLAANVVGWVVLLPTLGIVGAAVSSVAAYSFVLVRVLLGLRTALDVPLVSLLKDVARQQAALPALVVRSCQRGIARTPRRRIR